MLKMVGEYMKTNQEDTNMLAHGKKTRETVTVDKKHQHLYMKVILLVIKKKASESLHKMGLDMK